MFGIAALVLLALIIAYYFGGQKGILPNEKDQFSKRPTYLPTPELAENDKVVLVKGAPYQDLKKAVQQFCDRYNQTDWAAIPRLTRISETETAITFPRDLSFDVLCFFVNYIYYPNDIFYLDHSEIRAWATTRPGDVWVTEKAQKKHVMLYIPKEDDEYDNVYMTTEDGIGYKLGFAVGHQQQLLKVPAMPYEMPGTSVEAVKELGFEEVK